jgi:hypothetical protein
MEITIRRIKAEDILLIITFFNPLNAELKPIHHLIALAVAHHIVDVSRIRVCVVLWLS